MLAVTFQDIGQLAVEDVPMPELQEPGDALVRITSTAICGSDLHVLHGRIPGMDAGMILGHEFAGVVEAVGSGVTRVREGDRVLGSFMVPCGECWFCARGEFNRCPDARVYGYGVFLGDLNGSQAEHVRVPMANLTLHPLDDTLTDEQALFAGDIFTTAYDGARLAEIREGDTVVVQGCGPVGLLAIQAARTFSPGRIIAVDTVAQRLEMAQGFGAEIVDASNVHVPTHIQDATGGRGADVLLECVGAVPAFLQALDTVRAGGRIAVVGVYSEPEIEFPMVNAFTRGLDIRMLGTANIVGRWEEALDLIRSGRVDPSAIVSHRMPLRDALTGYRLFESREALKVVLTP